LNGKQAIGFVRFRHSDSDLIRTHRQQTLLAALKLKLLEPRTFAVLPKLMDTLDAHLDSDMTVDQKVALAYFLKDVPKSQIAMTTLPSIEGGYYVEPDWPKARPLITRWFGVGPPMASALPRHRRRHRRLAG
jgi:anionic cell wall polymer biosynthesis LytR-Cps2A-Psr (LCP) family protein